MPTVASLESNYGLALRGAVRALWKGSIDLDWFYDWMSSAIWRGLRWAWYTGAEEMGIQPSELSPAERMALQFIIAEEINHVADFAASIMSNSQASGGKLQRSLDRAGLWTARWQDVNGRARLMAGQDRKYKWTLGSTLEHCTSCDIKLNGKVKRGSYWLAHGVQPQNPPNPRLMCKGFH